MRRTRPALFRGRHFEDRVIVLCVPWYLRYCLTLRDLEELMMERGLTVDHSTIGPWVLRYAPELNKRSSTRDPAAQSLKTRPADLTALARNHNGQFPAMAISETLHSGSVAAHGSSDMPVWGTLLSDICASPTQARAEVELRIHNLTDYIKSLQK